MLDQMAPGLLPYKLLEPWNNLRENDGSTSDRNSENLYPACVLKPATLKTLPTQVTYYTVVTATRWLYFLYAEGRARSMR